VPTQDGILPLLPLEGKGSQVPFSSFGVFPRGSSSFARANQQPDAKKAVASDESSARARFPVTRAYPPRSASADGQRGRTLKAGKAES